MTTTERETPTISVRALNPGDLDDIVRIDGKLTGRSRRAYYKVMLQSALGEGVRVSLGAELGGTFVGFLIGSVYYGEYGQPEPFATLETVGVHPDFRSKGVASALWEQFATNLKGLRITKVQTQVDWNDTGLVRFFDHVGFRHSSRICLERALDQTTVEES
ncbi:MAG: GNAT family N-acetyltransferase [Deltaproteobacteria bacterium]|nr:GNAT family N-acetyltransferase [Deltaproteobacteria bacterium]